MDKKKAILLLAGVGAGIAYLLSSSGKPQLTDQQKIAIQKQNTGEPLTTQDVKELAILATQGRG